MNAFQEFDQGVLAPYDSSVGAFVLTNKFYVMTASRYLETAWGPKNKYSYFAKWLSSSIKTKGKMPADKNKNSIVTLNEWYNACAKKAKKIPARYRQHVQVYPANSGFELFYRKK